MRRTFPLALIDEPAWLSEARRRAAEFMEGANRSVAGHTKSVLLSILELMPFKPDSPKSTAMLKHYVEGSGKPFDLGEIPADWQDWIAKTHGGAGTYHEVSPYNAGIYDLRNSLGHFDLRVTANRDGTKTYEITDRYQFGFKPNDRRQEGRHGFPLGEVDGVKLKVIEAMLPSGTYKNPGGFDEKWEVKKVGKETILYVPQQYLDQQGKPFDVTGTFKR
jgi:hypothetical protein